MRRRSRTASGRLWVPGTLLAVGLLLAGCDRTGPPAGAAPTTAAPTTVAASATATPTTAAPASAGCASPPSGTAAAASAVVPGPSNGLAPSTATGEPLVVEAVVLDRSCAPAAGAEVHLWHADARGLYGPGGAQQCCYYDATVRTDAAGRFRVETIRPAQYPVPNAPPAHIHLEIGYRGSTVDTEVIFGERPAASVVPPTSGEVSIPLRRDGGRWRGEAVFVLGA